jgi:hypothetical protein
VCAVPGKVIRDKRGIMFTQKTINSYSIFFLFLLCLITLLFFYSPGTTDVEIWRSWAKNAQESGVVNGFAQIQADYPPLSLVILSAAGKLCRTFGVVFQFDAIKISILFFLYLTLAIYWLLTRDILTTILMYGAVMLNSAALVYLDIYFAPFLLLSLWALKKRRLLLFAITFTIACLIKWQPLIIAPFILVYLLPITKLSDWRQIPLKQLLLRVLLPAAGLLLLISAIFGITPVWLAFKASISHHYLSGNALNFNWILTHLLHILAPDQFGGLLNGRADYIVTESAKITFASRALFAIFYLLTMAAFFRREKTFSNFLIFTLAGFLAYFTFNIGVHENHLFLAAILAVMLFWEKREYWQPAILIVLINNINLYTFYGITGAGLTYNRVIGQTIDLALLLAIFNVLFFLFFWWSTVIQKHNQIDVPAT